MSLSEDSQFACCGLLLVVSGHLFIPFQCAQSPRESCRQSSSMNSSETKTDAGQKETSRPGYTVASHGHECTGKVLGKCPKKPTWVCGTMFPGTRVRLPDTLTHSRELLSMASMPALPGSDLSVRRAHSLPNPTDGLFHTFCI